MSAQHHAVCDRPHADPTRVAACIAAGVEMLRAGRGLDESCDHACALALPHERAEVRVGVERVAAESIGGLS